MALAIPLVKVVLGTGPVMSTMAPPCHQKAWGRPVGECWKTPTISPASLMENAPAGTPDGLLPLRGPMSVSVPVGRS